MKLEKFTWNNGTQSSPIVLTNDQIKKLIAIGQKEGLDVKVGGFITTNSRKMQKFLKYALEQQFKDLNIVCDEELADSFGIFMNTNVIKEGTKNIITIDTDSGITHDFLKWKYVYTDFIIDGDISEQNIKDRIRVENGQLVVDDPRENASWSVKLQLIAYPKYYNESDLDSIPASSKPDIFLTISAQKIEDIIVKTPNEVAAGADINVQVTPVPENSTKLKGATYTYSTNTANLVAINVSSTGTTIKAKDVAGTGHISVTLSACNNTVTKSNSTTFSIYDLKPVVFIIDQRGTISDPQSMVSQNGILNTDGNITWISNMGYVGDPSNNTLSWLYKNSHLYVGKFNYYDGKNRLKQLSDTSRKVFADGTSAIGYIDNQTDEYDVWLKFASDVYFKTEPWKVTADGEVNPNYILVTMARELPSGEDASNWQKWDKNHLIGVYESSQRNNKLYSISGVRPINNISQTESRARARARGNGFREITYDASKLMALIFYGFYSTLDCQSQCGYGTNNYLGGTYYPKITGITDELGMVDTNSTTGNGSSTDNWDADLIRAGIGEGVKSVNFWGLENWWGDVSEWLDDMQVWQIFNSSSKEDSTANPTTVLVSYLNVNNATSVTINIDGTDTLFIKESGQTWAEVFDAAITEYDWSWDTRIVSISNANNEIIRWIKSNLKSQEGYIKKMVFGDHADIFPKEIGGTASSHFADYGSVGSAGYVALRSVSSANPNGGVGFLGLNDAVGDRGFYVGSRLLFEGTDATIHIIDDSTEEL